MRIAIFGTGGVGGYFGGRLAQAGEEVVFIARGEHLRALRAQGLRVESIQGDFHVTSVQATDDPAQVGHVDVVLVGVKAWQVEEAARSIQPMVGPETCVVPLQNGLEAAEQIAGVLGTPHVIGGTCTIFSLISAPGCIRHGGLEPSITIGELDRRPSSRTERLCQALTRAGITATVAPDIRVPLWEKFLVLRWGIVGAVTRVPAGVLRGLDETRQMITEASQEVVMVAGARDIVLAQDIVPRSLAILDGLPPHTTTSLQRDIIEGRPSELEAQVGSLLRLGHASGTATPLHYFLYHSLLPQELRARGQAQW